MAIQTTILPASWPITVTALDRVPPLSFKVLDFDGADFSDYTPTIEIHKNLKTPANQTLTTTAGLIKTDSVTALNLVTTLPVGDYRWFGVVELSNGWQFTVFAAVFQVIQRGEQVGAITGLQQRIFTLPIRKTDSGTIQLLDPNGNPLFDPNDINLH